MSFMLQKNPLHHKNKFYLNYLRVSRITFRFFNILSSSSFHSLLHSLRFVKQRVYHCTHQFLHVARSCRFKRADIETEYWILFTVDLYRIILLPYSIIEGESFDVNFLCTYRGSSRTQE